MTTVHIPVNPFTTDTARLSVAKIIDRDAELLKLREALLLHRENVLVVGESGIGKTCLLRKFRNELQAQNAVSILMVEIGPDALSEGASKFLANVTLRIFSAAAARLFNLSPSALLTGLMSEMDITRRTKSKLNHFLKLFALIRPDVTKLTISRTNDAGVSFGASVKLAETMSTTRDVGGLSSFEFMELTAELLQILAQDGITQVVVFGDEANHLKPETEVELILHNLEAFAERNVLFVLTMRPDLLRATSALHAAFPSLCEVAAFSYEKLEELLRAYALCECSATHVSFSESIAQEVLQVSQGHPRQVQILGQKMWARAFAAERAIATVEDLLHAIREVYTLSPRL
ncbi:MAG TPA: AAA family ATPase [Thermoanaerobaculia bacterium]|nr:AAA family ATPase [Thermoanaerobaculia bacterium]